MIKKKTADEVEGAAETTAMVVATSQKVLIVEKHCWDDVEYI